MNNNLQPVLCENHEFVEWLSAEKEVRGACHLLNEQIYKKLAGRLRRESSERVYLTNRLYSCQSLFRDSFVKGLACSISQSFEWRCCNIQEFIKVGDFIFRLVKKDGRKQQLFYALQI